MPTASGTGDRGRSRTDPEAAEAVVTADVRAVLCDLGGVVIRIDPGRVHRRWADRSPLPLSAAQATYPDPVYEAFERGDVSPGEYLAHVRARLRVRATDQELIDDFNALYLGVDDEVVAVLTALRRRGLRLLALTNTNALHQPVWSRRFAATLESFDAVHCSHELRARKPEPAAFTRVLRAHGLRARQTLFVDDLPANVEAAERLGLHGIVFTDARSLQRRIADLPGLDSFRRRPRSAEGDATC